MDLADSIKHKRAQLKSLAEKLNKANLQFEVLKTGLFSGEASKAVALIMEHSVLEISEAKKNLEAAEKEWEALIAASGESASVEIE
jgi:hypothetical protein